jgi:hypothetical protein
MNKRIGTRDALQGTKDTLVNFVAWLRGNGLPADTTTATDGAIEAFLATQHGGPRDVPTCNHCGSTDVDVKKDICHACEKSGVYERHEAARVAREKREKASE